MEEVLTTESLGRYYKNSKALDGLNMHIPKGAIYGFVGKNGAGKTTLIRVICGLQKPSSGGYVLYGRKDTDRDIAKSRRRMGAVVETPAVYGDMSARDNLRQQYRILGLPSDDGITELLELTGGVIQGMSGSPILQDGKLIGAVTHVFVNDPTKGYGIFAETMVEGR